MGNIIINREEFVCEPLILGSVYRQSSNYIFNWETKGDEYLTFGLNPSIKLFYIPENTQPEELYVAQSIPFVANNFDIGILPYDQVSFRLEFSVGGGTLCYYSIDIPYSSIINL